MTWVKKREMLHLFSVCKVSSSKFLFYFFFLFFFLTRAPNSPQNEVIFLKKSLRSTAWHGNVELVFSVLNLDWGGGFEPETGQKLGHHVLMSKAWNEWSTRAWCMTRRILQSTRRLAVDQLSKPKNMLRETIKEQGCCSMMAHTRGGLSDADHTIAQNRPETHRFKMIKRCFLHVLHYVHEMLHTSGDICFLSFLFLHAAPQFNVRGSHNYLYLVRVTFIQDQ